MEPKAVCAPHPSARRRPWVRSKARLLRGVGGLAAVTALLLVGCSSSVEEAEPPGTIVLHDPFGAIDEIRFSFPRATPFAEAAPRVYAAAQAARLRVHDIYQEAEGSAREVVLVTAVGRPVGRLGVTIRARTLQALDLFGQARFTLTTRRGVEVDALVRERSWGFFSQRMELLSAGDLRLRVPLTDLLVRVTSGTALLLLLPFVVLRTYAIQVAARPEDIAEKLHRLSRAIAIGTLILPAMGVVYAYISGFTPDVMLVVGEFWPETLRWPPFTVPLLILALTACAWLPILGLVRGMVPTSRRLRGVEPRRRPLRLFLGLLTIVIPFAVAGLVLDALPVAALSNGLVLAAVLLGIPLLLLRIATVVVFAIRTRSLEEPANGQFAALRRRLGISIGDVRVLPGGSRGHAIAAVLRVAPGWTTIVVTDRLIDGLLDEELLAVFAHELGHVKHGDIRSRLRLCRWIWALALVAVVFLTQVTGQAGILGAVGLAFGAVLLGLLPTILLGPFAMHQEYRADMFAAAAVGATPMMRALEKLADLNMMKRRTGRLWNLMRQHPGIEERIERLRKLPATEAELFAAHPSDGGLLGSNPPHPG